MCQCFTTEEVWAVLPLQTTQVLQEFAQEGKAAHPRTLEQFVAQKDQLSVSWEGSGAHETVSAPMPEMLKLLLVSRLEKNGGKGRGRTRRAQKDVVVPNAGVPDHLLYYARISFAS